MHQLAQLNIARMTMSWDDPRMKSFTDELDSVNARADQSPGFVWRMVSEGNDDQALMDFEASGWLVNMSVWQDLESLRKFIVEPLHLSVMKRRADWFQSMPEATMVLWWIAAGHIPDFSEAYARLEHLRAHGSGDHAFTFSSPMPPPTQVDVHA